ncbi:hypothetical protein LCI18_009602 [Fusarium solani-melongenae]|uniref:Uncharacterized protein n=1 Tax=Fusarium solani subsp. cucurbitae TaxID=2747967 RepID=A0ACD3ZC06_FUSSC|nr:hypothetical protein LCI18_009602 [Fusarium solani-melongenae]
MVKSEEEGSADPYKITLSHFGGTVENNLSRRKLVQDVIDLYDKIRRGGNMSEEVQQQFFNDISKTNLKTAGSTHGGYKALKGNGGRHENRRFSNWVIVSGGWPDAEKLPEIRANMAKYWGLATFPDGEFPKVAADKQMTLYLGKLEKHTSKSKAKSKGKAPQKFDQGGNDGATDSDSSDSSDSESDDEDIIDEESTKAAQEARDKSLQEQVHKEKNSDSSQVGKASNSSGLMTMEKIGEGNGQSIKDLRESRSEATC